MSSMTKIYIRFIIYFIFFGVIVAATTSIVNYQIKYSDIEVEIEQNAKKIAASKMDLVKRYISGIEYDIHSILSNPLFIHFYTEPTPSNLSGAQNLFLGFSMANRAYFQVRYLDSEGQEIIRVDKRRYTDDVFIVPEKELQNKSDRYYFKETLTRESGVYWYSKLDLNIEHGKLEEPIRPTIRVASPVYYKGRFYGMIIINVEMSQLLALMKDVNTFDAYLVDQDGYFLLHPDDQKSWSRYLETGYTLMGEVDHNIAKQMLEADQYQSGIYHSFSLENCFKNHENIHLVFKTQSEYVEALQHDNYSLALYLAILILAISIPTGLLIALQPANIQNTLNQTLKENLRNLDIIDKYVISSSTDTEGRITEVSSAMCDISGYTKTELVGKLHSIVKSEQTPQETFKELWNKISSGLVWSGEIQNRAKNGDLFWLRMSILPQYDNDKHLSGYMAISSDITSQKLIEHISEHDKLTQIYNRVKLDKALEAEVERAQRYQTALSLIILDIDHFKSVNDTFGHQAGDSVLVEMAAILSQNIRHTDILGRWGGEEFLIICTHTNSDGARQLAEHLRQKVEEYDFKIVGYKTASFGAAEFLHGDDIQSLLKRADDNLYKAKESGRNCVVS